MSEPGLRADRCETCRFWDGKPLTATGGCDIVHEAYPDTHSTVEDGIRFVESGECHRHAPHVRVPAPDVSPPGWPENLQAGWPITLPLDWCGEWQAAAPRTPIDEAIKVLSGRAKGVLERVAGDRLDWSRIEEIDWEELRNARNCGDETMDEFLQFFQSHGMTLRGVFVTGGVRLGSYGKVKAALAKNPNGLTKPEIASACGLAKGTVGTVLHGQHKSEFVGRSEGYYTRWWLAEHAPK